MNLNQILMVLVSPHIPNPTLLYILLHPLFIVNQSLKSTVHHHKLCKLSLTIVKVPLST